VPTNSHGGARQLFCLIKSCERQLKTLWLGGGPFFGGLQWIMVSLPIKFKGLDLYSTVEAASYAFWLSGSNLGCYNIILRDSRVWYMDYDIYNASDGLRDTTPNFDFSNYASKDTVSSKAQYVLASVFLVKLFRTWKLILI
jgi:hypothetical protein